MSGRDWDVVVTVLQIESDKKEMSFKKLGHDVQVFVFEVGDVQILVEMPQV